MEYTGNRDLSLEFDSRLMDLPDISAIFSIQESMGFAVAGVR
jgi:hypothetical protein